MLGMVKAHAQIESNGFAVPEWEVGVYEFHRPTSVFIPTEGLLNRGPAERSNRTFTIWRQAGLILYGVQGSEAFLKTYVLTTRVTSVKEKTLSGKHTRFSTQRTSPHSQSVSWVSIHFGIKHTEIYRGTGKF